MDITQDLIAVELFCVQSDNTERIVPHPIAAVDTGVGAAVPAVRVRERKAREGPIRMLARLRARASREDGGRKNRIAQFAFAAEGARRRLVRLSVYLTGGGTLRRACQGYEVGM